jgi:hypothetical protein
MECPKCEGRGREGYDAGGGRVKYYACGLCLGSGKVPDPEPAPGEVAVIQYLRPAGERRIVFAPVGEEYVRRASGMIFSSEVLRTGEVAIYARWEGESEEYEKIEIGDNGPGENTPTDALKHLIDRKRAERPA